MKVEAGRHLEVRLYVGAEEVEHFSCGNEAKAIGYSIHLDATAMSIRDHAEEKTSYYITDPLNGMMRLCKKDTFMRSVQQADFALA